MGIFRGIGGTGNSTDDGVVDAVTEQAVLATNKANEAANSASSASNSATSASNSATSASTSATTATTKASEASNSATSAATSATSAATSATSATASATTATTKASEAATSATNAATSETNAATSATTATTKASEAATSATTATTKAGEASTSATNAASSATSASTSASTATTKASEASTSAASAASSYDSFDDRYLGAKSSAPTLDNDGDALITGALYFDTTSDSMKVYSGSAWLDAYATLSGALIATNNLSDLNNVSTARTNLGLGTAATTASTDYATAAQGTTADNALPKSGGAMTGAITTNSTFDGRDVSADGAKLDGIEASADVTDTANVTAAGALMDSELTSEASVKALNQGVATTDSPSFAGLTVDTNTLYVDATNNQVGIGTTTVGQFDSTNVGLTVDSGNAYSGIAMTDGATTSTLTQGYSTTYLYNQANGSMLFGTNNTERMRIDSLGRVGIGTSPSTRLHVNGGDGNQIRYSGATHSVAMGITSTTPFVGTITNAPLLFLTNASEKARIDSLVRMGIGTSSPRKKLHITGLTGDDDPSLGSSTAPLFISNTANSYGLNVGVNILGDAWLQAQSNTAATAYNLLLNPLGGNVGIGTSSPDEVLEVAGDVKSSGGNFGIYHFGETSDVTKIVGRDGGHGSSPNTMDFFTNSAQRMRIDSSGNLLVGTTDQNALNGGFTAKSGSVPYINVGHASSVASGNYYVAFRHGTNTIGTITQVGTSGVGYNSPSDYRLKENVVELTGATERLKQLKPSRFNFIADADITIDGFLAHEVSDIVPEAITGTKDAVDADGNPEYQGIDQSKLVPLLVATIQELEARITQLENN